LLIILLDWEQSRIEEGFCRNVIVIFLWLYRSLGADQRMYSSLATAFPGRSSVEGDFSILKLDKAPQRSNLEDLTTEGQFYARHRREQPV
jgi:hypothetical protein